MRAERNPRKALIRWNIAEGTFLVIVAVFILAGLSILTYQCSTSTGPFRREYSGKIVDKRISVFEPDQGSLFTKELIVEEKGGRRFTVSVTQEMYERAKPGMWIQKTAKGIELLPIPENSTSE